MRSSAAQSSADARTEREMANAIRALAMDAVQAANSGHPGMPMGMAEIAIALWHRHLRHNPANPKWADRDRFVLSNGHGSMLLYALLHLTGYDLPLAELKRFRQLGSMTPGHPEYGVAPGVETTTGPLGQGLANAVGMALAERLLAQEFNRPGFEVVDHHTYVFVGDGCLMEGISHEACSLAGTLALGKLVVVYDDNGISIDGHVKNWFTDDTPKRFEAYGWHVVADVDGHDVEAVDAALQAARLERSRPSLVCCKTLIAKGAPTKVNTHEAHGAPLGKEEVAATRAAIGWTHPPFEVPRQRLRGLGRARDGRRGRVGVERELRPVPAQVPDLAAQFLRRTAGELPPGWAEHVRALIEKTNVKAETVATRKSSQNALEGLAPVLPELFGGSADLTGSNLTTWSGSRLVNAGDGGNYLSYGVREFGMSAIANGMALHGGFIPYVGTFLTFSDYSRNALRMAALMRMRSIFVFTHDSIGLGEDGPTHQSVEHAAALRLIPGMDVWRPCDSVESVAAWVAAIERRDGPSALALQPAERAVPEARRRDDRRHPPRRLRARRRPGAARGDHRHRVGGAARARRAREARRRGRAGARGVHALHQRVRPPGRRLPRARAAARAAASGGRGGRHRLLAQVRGRGGQPDGAVVGIDRFGESAPGPELFKHFGFTVENVVAAVKRVLS